VNRERTNSGAWRWEITAACCFGGGIGAALIGSVLTAMTWFLGAALHPWLRGTGTALLIATIPLLIFSGYCLDWGEKRKHSFKRQQSRGSTETHDQRLRPERTTNRGALANSKPAVAGDSVKPGVERSGTPGSDVKRSGTHYGG
jgi:hypothetical protein